MLPALEQMGLEAAMVVAVAGSVVCLLFLVTTTVMERRRARLVERSERRLALPAASGRAPADHVTDLLYISIVLACFAAVTVYVALAARP